MHEPRVRRVIVVVMDGLRPDAIDAFGLSHLQTLRECSAWTMNARTVTPSVTASAMASLLCGAPPHVHGLDTEHFCVPVPRGPVHALPKLLAHYGMPTSTHMARLPLAYRPVGTAITLALGVSEAGYHGNGAGDIVRGCRRTLERQRDGLILLHLPDGDRAGHEHGWMSPGYEVAVRKVDHALGELLSVIDLARGSGTLLVALADHGGGGVDRFNHNSSHASDVTIPVMIAGSAVTAGPFTGPVSLLDVPATVVTALGVPQPASYSGHSLFTRFARSLEAA